MVLLIQNVEFPWVTEVFDFLLQVQTDNCGNDLVYRFTYTFRVVYVPFLSDVTSSKKGICASQVAGQHVIRYNSSNTIVFQIACQVLHGSHL